MRNNNNKPDSTTELVRLRHENSALVVLLESLVNELEKAQYSLEDLKNSTCWKITAPIRLLDKILFQKKFKKHIKEREKNIKLSNLKVTLKAKKLLKNINSIIYNPDIICFDVSVIINNDAGTGIQRVVREIAKNIICQNNSNYKLVDFSGIPPINVTSKFNKKNDISSELEFITELGHIVFLDSSWHIFNKGLDFFIKAKAKGVKTTTVIYDIFPLTNPELCDIKTVESYRKWFHNVLPITDCFLSISKATSDSIRKYIELNSSNEYKNIKYDYWHLGTDKVISKNKDYSTVSEEYILMVSTVEPRKNYEFVLDEITKLWRSKTLKHHLVIVGRPGWKSEHVHRKILSHPEYGKKLKWYSDGISDELLHSLYINCSALIQASLNEGFGLAVVEASNYQKPIVLSDIPVFREIVINNGYFFNIGSGDSFNSALLKALCVNAESTNCIIKNWNESYRDFVQVLSENQDY